MNGHSVAGNLFPVYVSIHPTLLGKPVKIWTGLNRPFSITANSKGEVFVALFEGITNIVKYDAEGKRVNLVEKSSLVKPRCIACDDEDNIYCIDEESNKILTCHSNGDRVQIHKVELEKNSRGRAELAITDQRLFMAEMDHQGLQQTGTTSINHQTQEHACNGYLSRHSSESLCV